MSLQVVAHLIARPETIDELKHVCLGLIPPTLEERGCISYQLYQNNANPADFTFIEAWESDAALDAHLKTPHLTAAAGKFTTLLAGPADIRRYTRLA